MTEKLIARSHSKKASLAGPPVLVILDPEKSIKDAIDFSKEEDVKLWVVNRLPIFYSEDGKDWLPGYGDFEGCLTEPEIIIKDGEEYQVHLSLKEKPYHIHYTSILPPVIEKQNRFETFGIEKASVDAPRKDIIRPYPEGLAHKEFNYGIYQNGMEVLRIPSSKVIYVSGRSRLRYWESVFYRACEDQICKDLKEKEIKGLPWTSKEADELKKVLVSRRGSCIGTIKQKEENIFVPGDGNKEPLDQGKQLFAFGLSEDVARSEGNGMPMALAGTDDEKPKQEVSSQVQLFQVSSLTPIEPTQSFYKDYINKNLEDMKKHLQGIDENTKDEDVLKLIKDYVSKLAYPQDPKAKQELTRQFHVCTEATASKCIMLAVNNAIANWDHSLSAYNSDIATDSKFDSSCVISVKPFYFATGSDAYSDDIVPKHIFFQIKEWWQDELYKYQRKEIAEETAEIEVVGYSSKKTKAESDNIRLRYDRAWKTAKSLELAIRDEVKPRDAVILPFPISSEHFRALGVSPKPVSIKNKLPIFYLNESLDIYPKRDHFRLEGNYVMDLVLDTQVSIKERLKASTDDPADRACLIIFKRPIPENVKQIVKGVVITNNASPIFMYSRICSHPIRAKEMRMVVFVCPGEFKGSSH